MLPEEALECSQAGGGVTVHVTLWFITVARLQLGRSNRLVAGVTTALGTVLKVAALGRCRAAALGMEKVEGDGTPSVQLRERGIHAGVRCFPSPQSCSLGNPTTPAAKLDTDGVVSLVCRCPFTVEHSR